MPCLEHKDLRMFVCVDGARCPPIQDSLTSKLDPNALSPLNAGLMKAINLVTRFLIQENEDASALEQLKAEVRRVLLSPPQMVSCPHMTFHVALLHHIRAFFHGRPT